MTGPLSGLRIVDATTMVLGPLASQQLADLGADVIKVETPKGDSMRYIGPTRTPGMAAYFLACNRNKRSVVLDLKQPAGHAALTRLLGKADVFLHNLRPQPAARLGLEYEKVRATNPAIVYCSTYGYAAAGPYADKAAYDDVIQAASGLVDLQAAVLDEPRYLPSIVADKTASGAVTQAVLAALVHKARTGEGQAVEVPMFETMVAWTMVEHLSGATYRPATDSAGLKRVLNRWRKPMPTQDGYIALWPYEDTHWREFFAICGREELLADPRFSTLSIRAANIEALFAEVATITPSRTTAAWMEALGKTNVPAMPVNTLDALLDDPQLKATGFWREVDHPTEGALRMTGFPTTFSQTPASLRMLQPVLGEHSEEVLAEAGYSTAEIDGMLASGATARMRGPRPSTGA